MNFSFSEAISDGIAIPATAFLYQDIATAGAGNGKLAKKNESAAQKEAEKSAPEGPSAQEISEMLGNARREAAAATEERLCQEYQAKSEREAAKIVQALKLFEAERQDYFSRVESEVVHLALAIATKILHREAQVDPLLVAALVRVAVDKLHAGSNVSVRIPPIGAEKWRERFANPLNGSAIAVVEDPNLGADDCYLETEVGTANFSIDAQLKEVEQGFFDLLAQRPLVK